MINKNFLSAFIWGQDESCFWQVFICRMRDDIVQKILVLCYSICIIQTKVFSDVTKWSGKQLTTNWSSVLPVYHVKSNKNSLFVPCLTLKKRALCFSENSLFGNREGVNVACLVNFSPTSSCLIYRRDNKNIHTLQSCNYVLRDSLLLHRFYVHLIVITIKTHK